MIPGSENKIRVVIRFQLNTPFLLESFSLLLSLLLDVFLYIHVVDHFLDSEEYPRCPFIEPGNRGEYGGHFPIEAVPGRSCHL
jgi:hypothetical protein